ncbi:MAG: orotidine-5'-phosphate decarboxylase [Micrococcus sp.]|nr:orotidine-5'-phosphate decarboxylase [Micrococcus sp.]
MSAPATPPATFGQRLASAMAEVGPLCLGIDPHPGLLQSWGLDDTAAGLEVFSLTVVEAATAGQHPLAAALKPQVALYERHGSAGLAALERTLGAAREAGMLTIADAKRGDIGSTMAGYAAAWLDDASPLAADAVTLSPYLGYESLRPALDAARATGRGVFVLALTSNPEGASVQHAGTQEPGAAVAARIAVAATQDNAAAASAGEWGSVGLVVGATVAEQARELGIDLAAVHGPLLAPGFGAQGATAGGMRADFGAAWPRVLASSSRAVLAQGPSVAGLRDALEATLADLR